MSFWNRRKAIDTAGGDAGHALKKTLSWYHLVALGVAPSSAPASTPWWATAPAWPVPA